MNLMIDTSNPERVNLSLTGRSKPATHIFKTDHNLSEVLMLEVQKFLTKQKTKKSELKQIEVTTGSGHFSRTRTAVAAANALAFGLGIKQSLIRPSYDQGPNISQPKQPYLTSF